MRNTKMLAARTSDLLDSRRLAGLLVVVAVLSVIVVAGGIRGQIIKGEALAEPLGSAPGIGDCLTQDPHKSAVDLFSWTPNLPTFELSPCTGTRFGEVVFVEPDFAAAMAATGPAGDPYLRCSQQADRYLGIPPRLLPDSGPPSPPATTNTEFLPAANVSVALFGPDSRQRAAGQGWAACVILLPTPLADDAPITLDHSLRGSWLRQQDSGLFSLCLAGPTSHVALNCNWPHGIEMIGMAWGNPAATQSSIDSACRETVVEAIGSAAALNSGTVSAVVVPVRPNPNNDGGLVSGPDAVSADSPYLNICLARATDRDGKLTAPLRGLGDAPVPIR